MQNSYDYNVIIVGAGPAGSTSARVLADAGMKVLILDKARFPRRKLCAGLITAKTVRLVQKIFGEGPDSLQNMGAIIDSARGFEILSKQHSVIRKSVSEPFRIIDRKLFDNLLLKRAVGAGAEFIGGETVKSVDILKQSITTQSGKSFSAGYIIGADGVNSRVRRTVPVELYGREEWRGGLAAAHERIVYRNAANRNFAWPALLFGYTQSGYGWVFPYGDRLKIGIAAMFNEGRKDILNAFHEMLGSLGLGEKTGDSVESYLLPYGNYLPRPFYRNILLSGDAAGYADPLLGEGIYYAQKSGELAASAIIEGNPDGMERVTSIYMRHLKGQILSEMIYAGKIRKFIYGHLLRYRCIPLKIALSFLGDLPAQTVHGIRSYRWMKKTSRD